MKRSEKIAELVQMTPEQLHNKSRELREELMRLRFRKATGQEEQNHLKSQLRKDIARVQTLLTQKANAA